MAKTLRKEEQTAVTAVSLAETTKADEMNLNDASGPIKKNGTSVATGRSCTCKMGKDGNVITVDADGRGGRSINGDLDSLAQAHSKEGRVNFFADTYPLRPALSLFVVALLLRWQGSGV